MRRRSRFFSFFLVGAAVAFAVVGSSMGVQGAVAQVPDVVLTGSTLVPPGPVGVEIARSCASPTVTVSVPDLGVSVTATPADPDVVAYAYFASLDVGRDAPVGEHEVLVLPESCGFEPASLTVLPQTEAPWVEPIVVPVGAQTGIVIHPSTCLGDPITVTMDGIGQVTVDNDLRSGYLVSPAFVVPDAPGVYPVVATAPGCEFAPTTLTTFVPMALTTTVGTDPDVCATTSTITVPIGTTVYYCYRMTNGYAVPLGGISTLVDDHFGPILTDSVLVNVNGTPDDRASRRTGKALTIGPGQSVDTVALGITESAVITEPVTNTAVWTVWLDFQCSVLGWCVIGLDAPPAVATVLVGSAAMPVRVSAPYTG